MKAYSKDLWGITLTEYNRLKEAVEQGAVLPWIPDSRIYELRTHQTTVDEIIRQFDIKKRFQSNYNAARDCITEPEFRQIVNEVLRDNPDVCDYRFFDMGVRIDFFSNSRKTTWTAELFFNDDGRITGKYRYSSPFPGASLPWTTGNQISRMIRSAMYE